VAKDLLKEQKWKVPVAAILKALVISKEGSDLPLIKLLLEYSPNFTSVN